MAGEISQRAFVGAAMVELLHTATLVHDDIVDQSEERRGVASINAVWKNKSLSSWATTSCPRVS